MIFSKIKSESWLKYLSALLLIVIPLYPKFPFLAVQGTFVTIRLEDLLMLVAGLTVSIYLAKEIDFGVKDKINKAILIYMVCGAISLFSAILVTHTVELKLGLLHLLRRAEYFIPFWLGLYTLRKNPGNLPFFLKLAGIVLLFVFIYGFGQKYFDWPVIITQNQEYSKGIALRYVPGGHINSTFAGHYDLGTYLVMLLPIILNLVFTLKNYKEKLFFGATWILGVWLLVNTASRISLFALVCVSALSLIFIRKWKMIPVVWIIIIIFAITSANLLARYERIIEVTKSKLTQINISVYPKDVLASSSIAIPERRIEETSPTPTPVFEDRSSNIRLNVEWPRAIRAFTKNPLLGTGYSSITLATDNDYLRALGETGILGLVSFGLIFITLIIELFRKMPIYSNYSGWDLALVAGLAGALPGIMLNALFIDVFEASKFAIMFWLIAGFAVSRTRST